MLHERLYVVSDPSLVSELFEKRAANYSDRKMNEMGKLIGWEEEIVFLNYGPLLKRFRTMLHRALNNRVSLDYIPLQQNEVVRFMRGLVDTPERFMAHIHLMAASIAIRIAYGHKAESINDRFVQNAEEIMEAFSDVSSPGKWIVNAIPILKYVPSWFPLAAFKRRVEHIRRVDAVAKKEPFEFVLEQMAKGTAEDSFTSKLLQTEDGQPVDDETKDIVKNIAGSLYAAGSDTTVAGIQSFFLAMTLYPDVQAKAHTEVSNYMRQRPISDGISRMILPEDRPNLPYTSALVREVLRWRPIVNIVPHHSGDRDDCNVVSGGKVYRIPARSTVVANIWRVLPLNPTKIIPHVLPRKMLHDPEMYPEPDRFNPERYLVNSPSPEPESYVFGFGRRICPGLHIAQQSMWITISNTLANFNIAKAKDENGQEITPEGGYTTGIIV
ncbi:cytochrome P450 family protein [Ceratobasidium sp. AG-Ba]|nr:cytochrome P450 family protein [Ceratobasidium sp. AG-Ba]